MTASRTSGLLLHPTSLPGPPGIGDLGPAADAFLDTLRDAEQSLWQVLPLGPTGYGDSPYQMLSAFAGNPLLVSPQRLVDDGLLAADELPGVPRGDPARVDFGAVIPAKTRLLRTAGAAFRKGDGPADLRREWDEFREREKHWLDGWTLFAALHDREKKAWVEWPRELSRREPDALAAARNELSEEIEHGAFLQFLFFRQWDRLRARAAEAGVRLFGDLPLFV
ncbi:MAG TPA: 4-alpha-glucanotransferase, partial [bacterium]|nr:4-alpha-glucanotransferase [bacterium]